MIEWTVLIVDLKWFILIVIKEDNILTTDREDQENKVVDFFIGHLKIVDLPGKKLWLNFVFDQTRLFLTDGSISKKINIIILQIDGSETSIYYYYYMGQNCLNFV